MSFYKSILQHKLILSLCVVAVVGGGWFVWKKARATSQPLRYVVSPVTRETVIVSVKGNGQVSGQSQLDLKPVVSGALLKILVKPGQEVRAQDPLFEIDQKAARVSLRDAIQSVNDARISLASAQLSLSKLKQPPDAVALVQAQNSLNQTKRELQKLTEGPDAYDLAQAETELRSLQQSVRLSDDGKTPVMIRDAYDDAVPLIKTTAQTLEQALYDSDAVLGIDNAGVNDAYERNLSVTDSSKLAQAISLYPSVKRLVLDFKRQADALKSTGEEVATIEAALRNAQESLGLINPFLQATYDVLLNTVTSPNLTQSSLSSLQSTIQGHRSGTASKLTSIITQVQAIASAKTSYTTAQFNVQKSQTSLDRLKAGADPKDIAAAQEKVTEAERALQKLQKGTDPIDLALSQNTVEQRRSALAEAEHRLADIQATLQDYTVRAPFDGIIAKVTAQVSDAASPSTVLATLLTPTKLAQISLNEVDATKVHVGQKATLTFDAIPNLSIAGTVYEVDPLGAVTQGVVNYTVKVAFETQDERIKSGMSVGVAIITDAHPDVLVIPNAALRLQGSSATVQVLKDIREDASANVEQGVLANTPPESRVVEIGLASDQSTEIVSGLQAGEQVVVRVIDPNAAAARATTAPAGGAAGIRLPGLGGGASGFGGGGVRAGVGR